MNNDISWVVLIVCLLIFFIFLLEIYVIILMATFLASWFGFSGILWWVCAILLFGLINGLIVSLWRI